MPYSVISCCEIDKDSSAFTENLRVKQKNFIDNLIKRDAMSIFKQWSTKQLRASFASP